MTDSGEPIAYLRASGPDIDEEGWLTDSAFDPGANWHTYRLEVEGSTIRFLIDGTLILEATDTRFSAGGGVELFNYGSVTSVGSVKVVRL